MRTTLTPSPKTLPQADVDRAKDTSAQPGASSIKGLDSPAVQAAKVGARGLGTAATRGGVDDLAQQTSAAGQTQASLRVLRSMGNAVAGAVLAAGLLLGSPAVAQTGAPVDTCAAPTEVTQVSPSRADTEAQVRAFAEGLEEAACALDKGGDAQGATAIRRTVEAHAPGGAADGTLGTLVASLNGDPDAKAALRTLVDKGEVKVEPQDDGWKISVHTFTGNDNAATLLDGRYRSDDGATANLGATLLATKADANGHGAQIAADVGLEMFTERDGMRRTDLVDALVTYAQRSEVGSVWLDDKTLSFTVGLESTGDFGGAGLQDGWHRLGEGTPLEGRLLGEGLQDTYTEGKKTSVLLGARASGTKDFGLVDLDLGIEGRVPVGPTGLGWVSSDVGLRIGEDQGLFGQAGIGARYQWTNGEAMDFAGAPIDGAVVTPKVKVGWQGEGWSVGLEWSRNQFGTSPGMGGMDDDRVSFGITIGGGQRWR